jgi:Zn-dependent protease
LTSFDLSQAVIFIGMFVLVSGPVHECAHAYVAWKLGDGTAKLFGRVSLDPIRHFDPVGGTLLIVSVIIGALSHNAVGFGWAKPTPVNPLNLKGRYADTMVAVAGPLSNLALAVVCAIGFRLVDLYPDNTSPSHMLALVFFVGIELNVLLMLFNLIPITPLDGSHVLFDLLDPRTAQSVRSFMNQYGLMLLIFVVLLARQTILPIVDPIVNFLAGAQLLG